MILLEIQIHFVSFYMIIIDLEYLLVQFITNILEYSLLALIYEITIIIAIQLENVFIIKRLKQFIIINLME